MKSMRKVFAMVLAVVLVLAMATTAFAAETVQYEVFQVFAADAGGEEHPGVLSNILWGENSIYADPEEGLYPKVDEEIINGLIALSDASDKEKIDYITPYVDFDSEPWATSTSNEIEVYQSGYYLIRDVAGSQSGENSAYTTYLVKVEADDDGFITVNRKVSVPSVKKVASSAFADTYEYITFTLRGTLPSTYADYGTYSYTFHDTMSEGLTFNEDVKVYLNNANGTDITDMFTIDFADNKLTVSCDNLKANENITKRSSIVVTYTAYLNENAVIGGDGNSNEVYVEYTNDPQGSTTGTTEKAEVAVKTFDVSLYKYDGVTNEPLEDAVFMLYYEDQSGSFHSYFDRGNGDYEIVGDGARAEFALTEEFTTQIISPADGEIYIKGIEPGTYYLTETGAPAGYNKADDITFTIAEDGTITIDGETVERIEVANYAGSTLPETGGMGTTMFYVFGAVLVMVAVVLLATKRRMSMNA